MNFYLKDTYLTQEQFLNEHRSKFFLLKAFQSDTQ
jgi:hypothetical protein